MSEPRFQGMNDPARFEGGDDDGSNPTPLRAGYKIVLDALETGMSVQIDGYKWVYQEGVTGAPVLCVEMWNETKKEVHYVNPDMTFNAFMAICHKLTEKELLVIGANAALNHGRKWNG